jgi:hypothetical protein
VEYSIYKIIWNYVERYGVTWNYIEFIDSIATVLPNTPDPNVNMCGRSIGDLFSPTVLRSKGEPRN